ncbi:MAG: bifunctional adenosylcobinamide kinase/adenosylcobinamide-phosphate guanylyltransferase [Magnetococcales bacterium]|nr:bifunctional adenosylcobinamide kinase/adenosylcobinamide-phosphate guanylyltransferase [Magnetococcales bacterium]
MRELVLGGVRSGKSAHAETLARRCGLSVTVVATGLAEDSGMAARIARHKALRPAAWRVVEEPLSLGQALKQAARSDGVLLVDCLTVWLSNLMAAEAQMDGAHDGVLEREKEALLSVLPTLPGQTILVSNEVGFGGVSMHPVGRRFQDQAGELNQALAKHSDRVTWVMAGLVQVLKG